MVKINYFDPNNVLSKLKSGEFKDANYFELNYIANKLLLKGKRENLMILDELQGKITIYPHQIETALKYLNDMNGRILIADEVGLGKTIEAGIILKELLSRDQVNKVLILTPASLSLQWQAEMLDKFGIDFEVNRSVHHWSNYDKIIASIDTAKNQKHLDEIEAINWDLLIVDEAHKLKNSNSIAHKAVKRIKANQTLFLTATPMQNNLLELFHIINLLDEGCIGTAHEFNRRFVKDKNGLELNNKELLNELLQKIMVRSTRKETGLEFTKRRVHTVLIEQTDVEKKFMDAAIAFIQKRYENVKEDDAKFKGVGTLQLMSLARMATSCRYAFAKSFRGHLERNVKSPEMIEEGEKLLKLNEILPENKKFKKTIELVKKIDDQVIIFTGFLQTQSELVNELTTAGYKVEEIKGEMSPQEKKYAIRNFKQKKADVLVSTESGSEGLNLQFCHNLINYDLPWNPMRIEQRIGRIHRIGQEYDVIIYNLCYKGTIEEYILERLYKKIDLFHLAVGEMADIISGVEDETSFDGAIFKILMQNKNKIDVHKKLAELFQEIKKSKEFQENIKKLDSKTFKLFDLSPIEK